MNMMNKIETDRLILRPIRLSDADSYQKNFCNYEIIRHLSHLVPWPYPDDGAYQFIKNVLLPNQGVSRWTWVLLLKDDPSEIIGAVDLWREAQPENRGFWLAHPYWGNGFMREATDVVTQYAFTDLGFEKLVFANAVGNIRSRKIKEKSGARLLETRPAQFVDPIYTEHEIWQLTKAEWLKSSGQSSSKS